MEDEGMKMDENRDIQVRFVVIAVIAVYVKLAVFGLFGNIWVMWTVLSQLLGCASGGRPHKPPLQSSAFIYLLLLSVVDTISFLPIPLLVTDLLMWRWPFGLSICKFFFICEAINKTLSPMVLTALSIDRYIAVCKPTLVWMRQTHFSLLVVFLCVLLSMTFIIFIGFHAKIEVMPLTQTVIVDKCTLNTRGTFDIAQAIACYVIPLLLICSVYTAILNKLYRHTRISSVGRKTSISLSRVVKCSVLVVAFYFICWTPYFTMQLHHSLAGDSENKEAVSTWNETEAEVLEKLTRDKEYWMAMKALDNKTRIQIEEDQIDPPIGEKNMDKDLEIFLLYMLHALPYTQSAFNWLFYAFLNRNLRNSGQRANGVRSTASTFIADCNSNGSVNGAPIWRNIQQVWPSSYTMGSTLKAAGMDTGHLLMRNSPFRGRSKKHYRSSTCLEKPSTLLVSSTGLERSSMLELPVERDCLNLLDSPPRSNSAAASLPQNSIHTEASATSSVEWL